MPLLAWPLPFPGEIPSYGAGSASQDCKLPFKNKIHNCIRHLYAAEISFQMPPWPTKVSVSSLPRPMASKHILLFEGTSEKAKKLSRLIFRELQQEVVWLLYLIFAEHSGMRTSKVHPVQQCLFAAPSQQTDKKYNHSQ